MDADDRAAEALVQEVQEAIAEADALIAEAAAEVAGTART